MLYYGFYNSINNDRLYDAKDLGRIFDGIINDGVYSTILRQFMVRPGNGRFQVTVDTGRAWFNHTWVYNDSALLLQVEPPCTVVIEINEHDRVNRIRSVKTVTNTSYVHQYPIAMINVGDGSGYISQSQIVNMVGSSSCPIVTGPLQVMNIDQIVAQWASEWRDFTSSRQTEWQKFLTDKDAEVEDYIKNQATTAMERLWATFKSGKEADWNNFKSSRSNEWYSWLNTNTAQFTQQWNQWFHANTVGKSEKWEEWYTKMTTESENQWNTWFEDTTRGQIEKWWEWWEENHKVLTSAMIQLWWEWWNPFKEEKEEMFTTWYTNFTQTSELNWNTWFDAVTTTTEQALSDWWQDHIPVWENQFSDWWDEHPPVWENDFSKWWQEHPPVWEHQWTDWWGKHPLEYEKTYQEWFDKTELEWERLRDKIERWFEDFTSEAAGLKWMPYYNELTDETHDTILDSNGTPIITKNYVNVL